MTTGGVLGRQLDWLLTEFARGTPGVLHAVAVSSDGPQLAASDRVCEGPVGHVLTSQPRARDPNGARP